MIGLGSSAKAAARVVVSSVRRAGQGLLAAAEFMMNFVALKAGSEARTINRKGIARDQFIAHQATLI